MPLRSVEYSSRIVYYISLGRNSSFDHMEGSRRLNVPFGPYGLLKALTLHRVQFTDRCKFYYFNRGRWMDIKKMPCSCKLILSAIYTKARRVWHLVIQPISKMVTLELYKEKFVLFQGFSKCCCSGRNLLEKARVVPAWKRLSARFVHKVDIALAVLGNLAGRQKRAR